MTRFRITNRRASSHAARFVVVVASTVVMLGLATNAAAAAAPTENPVDGGAVTVVEADDRSKPIERAESATIFALALPDDARCPGDSAFDQYRVHAFIVPAAVDPATLKFGPNDPDGTGNWSLYGVDTSPYINRLTVPNTEAGRPARIADIDPLSFAVFPPGTLPDGEYTIGMACSYFRDITTYWDTNIVVTADAQNEPGQMTWRLATATATAPGSSAGPGTGLWLGVGAATLAVVASVALIAKRRRTTSPAAAVGRLNEQPNSHVRTIKQETNT